MRKVTFLVNSFSFGGAERVLSVIVSELVKQKYEVEVISLERNEFYQLPKEVKKTYLSDFTGKESGLKKLLYLPIFAWKLKKCIKSNNIRLVQSHLYRANYVNLLAKLFGANHKTQIVNAGVISRYKKEGLVGKINLFLIKKLYPKADLIIWKSKGMQIDANRLFNFYAKQIVINNPYDIKKIQNLAKEEIKDFKFDKSKIYLISVGRLISLKRNEDLIQALKFLDERVEVLFLGDGEKKEYLKKLVKDLNLGKRVHFLGNVSNPFKYLAKSNIFIHTSETEGFPNVLIEAMACGLPVISSDCLSGPREILAPDTDITKQLKKGDGLEEAKYGILFPVGDIEALVDAIKMLLNNKEKLEYYKNQSLKRCKDFSVEKIVNQYKKVLLNEEDSN